MQKTCSTCTRLFDVSSEEEAFLHKMQWSYGGRVFHPAESDKCPECRMRIRVAHRNEKNLYRNVSALSGKSLISIYAPQSPWGEPHKVYNQDEWNSDDFDAVEYGRDIDFGRSFFEQFAALSKDVPRMAVVTLANENSEYATGTAYSKNCYLVNSTEYCEDCYYGKLYQNCSDIFDSAYMFRCELCYGCFSLYDCSRCTYVYFSKNSHDCFFSSNLQGCRDCFLCTNLTQKQYCFRNEQFSKEEYSEKVKEYAGSYGKFEEAKTELEERMKGKIWKYANIVDSENCTGDYIEHSRNCVECYDMDGCEDCRHVQVGVQAKDCQHCSNMYVKPQLCYETLGTIEAYNCAYCLYIFHSQNMLYCEQCYHCSDCFGCSGLKRKKYCIFNKQYTKEEYEALVPRMIADMQKRGEWGMFFPPHYSAFGYNESVAQEYLPMEEKEAKARGFLWRTGTDESLQVNKVIPAGQLPDRIDDVPDEVANWAVSCAETGRPFRLLKQEIQFYRSRRIPLPRLHPDVRYDRRMQLRNPRHLWSRPCMKCAKEIQTTYAPDRPETVYCEGCYLEAVY